jgi:outer membrane immunogenic protein
MGKFSLSAALLALSIGAAAAADMPVKARPLAAPLPMWTGFYGGFNAGGGFRDGSYTNAPAGCFLTSVTCGGGPANNPLRTFSRDLNGAFITGGLQGGYNWQVNQWVLGFEADINGASRGGTGGSGFLTLAPPLVGNMINVSNASTRWFGTARARVGWLYQPTLLLYATGGLAFGDARAEGNVSFTSTADVYHGTYSSTRAGWTAGAGAEWMLATNWSLKLEYLYVDLGSTTFTDACSNPAICGSPPQVAPGAAYSTRVDFRDHIARLGFNYHLSPTLR